LTTNGVSLGMSFGESNIIPKGHRTPVAYKYLGGARIYR